MLPCCLCTGGTRRKERAAGVLWQSIAAARETESGRRATGDKEFARPCSALGLHARWPIRSGKHTTATVKGARAVGRAGMLGRAAGTTRGTRDDGGAHLMVRQCLCRDQGAMEAAHTLRRTPEQVGGEAACVDPCPAPRTRGRGQWAPQCWRNRGGRGLNGGCARKRRDGLVVGGMRRVKVAAMGAYITDGLASVCVCACVRARQTARASDAQWTDGTGGQGA